MTKVTSDLSGFGSSCQGRLLRDVHIDGTIDNVYILDRLVS